MKLILTRHGETIENQKGIIQGHLPGKLSKCGIEQAKKLAIRLKNEKIDVIYSSDLARAADTAKEIVKFHPDVPVYFIKELREKHMGEFQGKTDVEIGIEKARKLGKLFPQPKGGETLDQVHSRANGFYEDILCKYEGETVLAVGHGCINLHLMSVIMNKPFMDIVQMVDVKNTSINIFEIDKDKNLQIHILNCTKHLK